jgi:hypothetical protein
MDIVAAAGRKLNAEENAFATPESTRRQPIRDTASIEAFQACAAALDAWPLTEPMTGWDVRMIAVRVTTDAQSAYLRRLAAF